MVLIAIAGQLQKTWSAARQTRLATAVLVCLTLSGIGPSRSQDQPGLNVPGLDAPWERTADGRVLIPVLGQVLAFPGCGDCLRFAEFISSNGPAGREAKRGIKLYEAIDHPSQLRRFLEGATSVMIRLSNIWDRSTQPFDYLGRFDPRSVPQAADLYLTVRVQERSSQGARAADHLEAALLAAMQRRSASDEAEFTKIVGTEQSLEVPRDRYMIVSQRSADNDARGLPLYARCSPILGFCEVGSLGPPFSYALRSDVRFYYSFSTEQIPLSDFRSKHEALRAALASLIVDRANMEQKP